MESLASRLRGVAALRWIKRGGVLQGHPRKIPGFAPPAKESPGHV
jgi:hypothetical protein